MQRRVQLLSSLRDAQTPWKDKLVRAYAGTSAALRLHDDCLGEFTDCATTQFYTCKIFNLPDSASNYAYEL